MVVLYPNRKSMRILFVMIFVGELIDFVELFKFRCRNPVCCLSMSTDSEKLKLTVGYRVNKILLYN